MFQQARWRRRKVTQEKLSNVARFSAPFLDSIWRPTLENSHSNHSICIDLNAFKYIRKGRLSFIASPFETASKQPNPRQWLIWIRVKWLSHHKSQRFSGFNFKPRLANIFASTLTGSLRADFEVILRASWVRVGTGSRQSTGWVKMRFNNNVCCCCCCTYWCIFDAVELGQLNHCH